MEEAANADNDDDDDDDETTSADKEEEDDIKPDTCADEGEEDAKPAVSKELLKRMMVGEISAEEAEIVGRDFFNRVAAMVAGDT